MRIRQVRKVRRQRRPGYPTRPEVARDPELLRRHVPAAWKKSAQVTAALSIMLASAHAQDAPTKAKTKHVAPIFEHGDGYNFYGGPPSSPPAYISEEEGCKIIAEELQKAGISAASRNEEFKDIPIRYDEKAIKKQDPWECSDDDPSEHGGFSQRPKRFALKGDTALKVDLVDEQKGLAVEFVSFDDTQAMGGRLCYGMGVMTDVHGVAEALQTKIDAAEKAPAMYYGIFYDPTLPPKDVPLQYAPKSASSEEKQRIAVNNNIAYRKSFEHPSPESIELLRAQVRDFITWLKGQGAI